MIKLKELLKEDSWDVKDGRILLNGKPVFDYDFDRGSDSFWVDNPKGKGQLAFDTKAELIAWAKKTGIRQWKGVREGAPHSSAATAAKPGERETVYSQLLKWGNNEATIKKLKSLLKEGGTLSSGQQLVTKYSQSELDKFAKEMKSKFPNWHFDVINTQRLHPTIKGFTFSWGSSNTTGAESKEVQKYIVKLK